MMRVDSPKPLTVPPEPPVAVIVPLLTLTAALKFDAPLSSVSVKTILLLLLLLLLLLPPIRSMVVEPSVPVTLVAVMRPGLFRVEINKGRSLATTL